MDTSESAPYLRQDQSQPLALPYQALAKRLCAPLRPNLLPRHRQGSIFLLPRYLRQPLILILRSAEIPIELPRFFISLYITSLKFATENSWLLR